MNSVQFLAIDLKWGKSVPKQKYMGFFPYDVWMCCRKVFPSVCERDRGLPTSV